MKNDKLRPFSAPLFAAMMAGTSVFAGQMATAEMDVPREQRHILNLSDVEIGALIEDVSLVTGYTFIVHPQVRGRVTVMSQTPLSTDEVFDVFLSTLKVHQFVAVPAGERTYKIVPEASAVGDARVLAGRTPGEQFVTEIISLDYFNAVEAAQLIKPMVNASGQVMASKNSNSIIIVDYAANLPRIREVVSGLDEDRSTVETIQLQNIPATEMEKVLNGLQGRAGEQFAMNFTAIAAEASNAIVIRGEDVSVTRVAQVARELDRTEPSQDTVRVVSLSNAKADELVPILETLGRTMAAQRAPGSLLAVEPTVVHHDATNSLVLTGDPATLRSMDRVIEALDVRRPQVLVEAIIVEMSDSAVQELGLQFVVSGRDGDIPFASTNFSRSAPNMLALTGALVSDGGLLGTSQSSASTVLQTTAVNSLLGLDGLTIGGAGTSGNTLFGVIANALAADSESNILSTPYLMTLDNEQSSFLVGQEIPVTTGEVLGANNSNPFRTVEREDVGVKLEVTPQIGEGDTIKLQIFQEVSNVSPTSSAGFQDIITNKRQVTTTVAADDGEIVVLGGLIEEQTSVVDSKVPILGDIPGLGRLFSSEGTSKTRTNLMVFLKPTIIRDSEDAKEATAQKYRYVRAQEILRSGDDASNLDAFVRDVLGDQPPN